MFVGRYEHSMSKDGRGSIPSKLRDVLKRDYKTDILYLLLMPGNVPCLYPEEEFKSLVNRLESPFGTTLDEHLQRERLSGTVIECKIDGSGRIIVPMEIREIAGLHGDTVLVVGAQTHIELWNMGLWGSTRPGDPAKIKSFMVWPADTKLKPRESETEEGETRQKKAES